MIFFKKRTIGKSYLTRYFLIPRNRWFNVYLHKFSGSDDGRALHDHPWWSVSVLLKGSLWEVTPQPGHKHFNQFHRIRRFIPRFRRPTALHRIVKPARPEPAWTLFITGPRRREWGFQCPDGWRHYKDFDARGCE